MAGNLPRCSYCDGPCDKRGGCFVVVKREGERTVARAAACSMGCLLAVADAQRPRGGEHAPIKGRLEEVGRGEG